jgi:hypothetical protein
VLLGKIGFLPLLRQILGRNSASPAASGVNYDSIIRQRTKIHQMITRHEIDIQPLQRASYVGLNEFHLEIVIEVNCE